MNAKFLFAVVALVALVANAYAQSECATAVLGSRDIDSVVIFSDLRALPELVLNDVVQGSILKGQAWTVVRFDSFSEPTVSLEIDCGVDFESCSPSGTESQTTRTANHVIDDNTFSQDDGSFGFVFGDRRTTTLDLNCESAFNSSVSLSASAKIGVPENLVVVSGNGDDSNTCDMTTSVEWTFGNFDLRPYAGRGFVLTFVDFEREKDDPLDGQITITQANGNTATATRELRVGANEQTTFIFEYAGFETNGGNLNNILANAVSVKIAIFGIADDDFVVDFLATYAHFVTGRLNAGCPGETANCNGDEECTVSLLGIEMAPVPNTEHSDQFDLNSGNYYSVKTTPVDVTSLPYTSFDWAAYVTCGSNGYFWFAVNPGTYTVTMSCESDDPVPADGYDFCTAFISDAFSADRLVHEQCGGDFDDLTWGDIQCISNRTVPVCSFDDQVYPSIGLQSSRHVNNDLIPCINFEFTLTNVGFEFICPDDVEIDCAREFPDPVFEARDPICDTPIPVEVISDDIDDENCCLQTRVVVARASNDADSKTCTWTATRTDTTAPVFVGLDNFQSEYTLDCDGCSTVGECTDEPVASDNCCRVIMSFEENPVEEVCQTTLNREWSIKDECGNERARTVTQTVVLMDMVPAEISCPEDVTIDCDFEDFPPPRESGRPTVTDDCTDTTFRFEDNIDEDDCDNQCEGGLTRTFFGKDQCHPEVSCTQRIKIIDEEAPELVIPPDVTDIECGDSLFPENAGTATACDLCDPRPQVYFEDSERPLVCDPEACLWKRSLDRQWFAADRCEQITTADDTQRVEQLPCPPCKQLIDVCVATCRFNRNRLCDECSELSQNQINNNNLAVACGNGSNNDSKCSKLTNKCTRVCLAEGLSS